MKLIVFSDSHGRTEMLRRAAEAHFADPDTAGVVHLGDGIEDLSFIDTGSLPVWRVRGILRIICIPTVRAATPLRAS